MSGFLGAIQTGIDAAVEKENNILQIVKVIEDVRKDLEQFSENKLTLVSKVSQIDALNNFTIKMLTPQINKEKPLNEVLFIQLNSNKSKEEELTMLYLGSEGFPCTIYAEGNQLTATDELSFRENMKVLLGSPSTGQKIGRLLKAAEL